MIMLNQWIPNWLLEFSTISAFISLMIMLCILFSSCMYGNKEFWIWNLKFFHLNLNVRRIEIDYPLKHTFPSRSRFMCLVEYIIYHKSYSHICIKAFKKTLMSHHVGNYARTGYKIKYMVLAFRIFLCWIMDTLSFQCWLWSNLMEIAVACVRICYRHVSLRRNFMQNKNTWEFSFAIRYVIIDTNGVYSWWHSTKTFHNFFQLKLTFIHVLD